ncbi:MAG: response regulator transcription factor [Anaerolineales bacterium]|nr:MAG: response regulator transcription factor [Anaerolineales bacterium]
MRKKSVDNSIPSRVLLIDDDDSMVEMLLQILEPELFQVVTADNSLKGIETVQKFFPDVVIINLLMPDMSGWEICKTIRDFSQVPILVLSAISKPGMVSKALDEGADDYLIKPVTSSVLIAHVKRLARRARAKNDPDNPNIVYCEA